MSRHTQNRSVAAGSRRRGLVRVTALGVLLATGVIVVLGLYEPQATLSEAGQAKATAAESSGPSFAIRARLVYPVTREQSGPIERGMIIVRDGRIEAVGQTLEVPEGMPLIDLRDGVICPGFVSAGSAISVQHAGPHAVSGAYRAIDTFNRYAKNIMSLSRGTTTVHLNPGGHRLVSGVGAVVKLAGPSSERTLITEADLNINLGVFDPPAIVKMPFFASSDVAIEPAERQGPDSRLGQYLELEKCIKAVTQRGNGGTSEYNIHVDSFAAAWTAGVPLRVNVRRGGDIEGALHIAEQYHRPAYLVGLAEGDLLGGLLQSSEIPVVFRMEESYRGPGGNLGDHPEAFEARIATVGELAEQAPDLQIALTGGLYETEEDLRIAAMHAVRGGMSSERALAGITRVPAEILGVADRVGSLTPGKDADLLVLSGEPLDLNSYVREVYVGGKVVFEAPPAEALVVRAGRVWIGDGTVMNDASVLIEDGKIQAVGQRVPHPPFARIIDAGADSFLTPGFIDAHGHLGLQGDYSTARPDLPIHRAIAVAGRDFHRVAHAGVTTVMLAPYRGASNGARMAAIKTHGSRRSDLVARELSGLRFSMRGKDPLTGGVEPLRKAFAAGKKYYDKWKKYEEELVKWKEAQAKGEVTEKKAETETIVEEGKADPITGTWEFTIQGGPMPEPVTGTMMLKLTGSDIEGRMSDPQTGEETTLSGTLEGNDVKLEIEVEDSPVGNPVVEATLDVEDHMVGKVLVMTFEIEFEATRTDKTAVEFKITRKRKQSKDGRPAPPKIDENLEPFRALIDGKIPAVVEVETAAQIEAAIKLFIDEFKVSLVLLGAEDATDVADRILASKDKLGGVVVPPNIERRRLRKPYTQAADLSRKGIPVALQSNAEDGARTLPLMGLYAAQRGMGGDAVLKALTFDAAKMYKLDDRVGSIQPGKDADILIFSGHPFDAGSRLERVIVAGQEVPDE